MKIECDKCAAKYSIADEKVRGKTFKIRCKKCSNVIIVRDKGDAAAAGAGAAAPADHAPGWHLAINGETVGPMPEDEVRQRYDAGEIDKETAIWQEGFEDWVPLGDVDAFASLPDRGAGGAAAEDPFASANQDDYAAPAAAAAAVGAAAPMEQPQSPRVSQLTGQRNENSVLFSLDSLQALATGGGAAPGAAAPAAARAPATAARAAANPSKGLSTSAPSSEGSGLIDIRALGAMVGGGGGPAGPAGVAAAPAADDTALPSFGGGSLGGLTSAPLVSATPAVDHAAAVAAAQPAQPQRSQAPLYIMMAFLLLAVAGLVAFVVLREPETQIVKETVNVPGQPVPSVADSDKDKDKDKDDEDSDKDKDKDKDKDDAKDDGEDPDAKSADAGDDEEDDGEDAAGVAGSSRSGKKKKKNKKSSGGGGGGSSNSGGGGDPLAEALGGSGSSSTKKKKASGGGDPGVECILDPSKCGGGSKKSTKKAPQGGTDPNLPDKLTSTDIKNGVAPHKAAAKACGSKYGGKAGDKVTVKLSISGATGKVTSASATGTYKGTPLGNCVAAALKSAQFSKFKKPSLGVQYPIRL